MLKYLIIHLDDTATSFCHYDNNVTERKLMALDLLKKAIVWSMKENLMVQFVCPDSPLPEEYKDLISEIDHISIVSSGCEDMELSNDADIMVINDWDALNCIEPIYDQTYVIRTTLADLLMSKLALSNLLSKVSRINIVIKDVASLTADKQYDYSGFLKAISATICDEYAKDHPVQLNILTDRMMLDGMNNCNAGSESVTLAPDGKFYICPAFYFDGKNGYSIGDLENGLDIKNSQLYRLDHAPICRICDAWQCKRCVWLNRKMTFDINTPSHEQCVISHIEREASRQLLSKIRKIGEFLPDKEIPEIDYLDPLDKLLQQY